MAMLHPCPRCTQALPSTACFCRRCGVAVDLTQTSLRQLPAKKNTTASPFFFPLFLGAIVFAGVIFWRFSAMPTSVQTSPVVMPPYSPPMYSRPTYSTPIPQPVYRYQPPMDSEVREIQPLVVPPVQQMQPIRVGEGGGYREYRGDGHHQSR